MRIISNLSHSGTAASMEDQNIRILNDNLSSLPQDNRPVPWLIALARAANRKQPLIDYHVSQLGAEAWAPSIGKSKQLHVVIFSREEKPPAPF